MSIALPTNPYAIRARSLYIRATIAWMAGYIAGESHPLTHYIATTLLDARARYPEAPNWQFEAIARHIKRLMETDYEAHYERWSPSPDDPNAWSLDSEVQARVDQWLGRGQGGY